MIIDNNISQKSFKYNKNLEKQQKLSSTKL